MIDFNVPPCTGNELKYIEQAIRSHRICGDGEFTARCSAWLEQRFGAHKALLTTSGTHALEMAAILCDLTPGDVAGSAAKLLKNGGRFCAVFPAPRAYELMRAMDDAGIAPKRVQVVQGVAGRAPKFVLLEGIRHGGDGLHWLPPLVLRHEDGSFTDQWHEIYGY